MRLRLYSVTLGLFLALLLPNAASAWSQYPSNPVLTATLRWEGSGVHEPTVLHVHGRYLMYYNAGNWFRDREAGLVCGIGVATSKDGRAWVKYTGNPIIGQGRLAPEACHNNVVYYRGTFYAFYTYGSPRSLHLATSRDGFRFRTNGQTLLQADPTSSYGLANTFEWVQHNHWRLLYEQWIGGASGWDTSLAAGLGFFHWKPAPALNALQLGTGTFGGIWLEPRKRGYRLHYHASYRNILPTDIYYRDTVDFRHWTKPVLELRRSQAWEFDQVADPSVVTTPTGKRLLYFDGEDNPRQFSAIGMAS